MIRNQGDEDGSESPTKQQHRGSPVKTVMSKFQRGPKGGNSFKGGKGKSIKVFKMLLKLISCVIFCVFYENLLIRMSFILGARL